MNNCSGWVNQRYAQGSNVNVMRIVVEFVSVSRQSKTTSLVATFDFQDTSKQN